MGMRKTGSNTKRDSRKDETMKTPITDELRSRIPEPRAIQEMIASHSDIERELAEAKENLRSEMVRADAYMEGMTIARAERDDLANAVRHLCREVKAYFSESPKRALKHENLYREWHRTREAITNLKE
jgi:hypothetical protein